MYLWHRNWRVGGASGGDRWLQRAVLSWLMYGRECGWGIGLLRMRVGTRFLVR